MKPIAISPARLRYAEAAFWLLLAASFFLLPGKLSLLSQIMIFGLFAVSLDIALGYAGIVTVGHAAFFGAGAYAAGLLAKHGWTDVFPGLLLALCICTLLGYLVSFLIVRGADLTRLMITIGICVLLSELANRLTSVTGGSDGLQGVMIAPVFGKFEFDLAGKTGFWLTYAVVLLAFLCVRLVIRSPFGLALRGIHDSRKRMLAIGSPVDARLRTAYALSAGVAGVAGALLAQTTQFVGLETIGFNRSAEVLIILVLGGTGRLYGGLIGAIVYMLVHDAFAEMNPQYWMLWLGIFLIAAVMLGRGGFMGVASRLFRIGRPS
jgi:branched-chain amino acid transport system permease protein